MYPVAFYTGIQIQNALLVARSTTSSSRYRLVFYDHYERLVPGADDVQVSKVEKITCSLAVPPHGQHTETNEHRSTS